MIVGENPWFSRVQPLITRPYVREHIYTGMEGMAATLYFLSIFNYTVPACSLGEAGKPLQGKNCQQCVFMLSSIHSAKIY